MNKSDVSAQLKLSIEKLDEVLTAALLPLDAADYSPEQIKILEELINLVENKQAKTFKEAGMLYRGAQNAQKLKEIALRHEVADEHVPEILKAMKLKVEALAEPQFELFREVCQAMQSGVELPLAAQMSLDKGKGDKGAKNGKAVLQAKTETAIAKTKGEALTETTATSQSEGIALLEAMPNQEMLRDKARQEATLDQSGFTTEAVEEIFNTSDQVREQGKNYGRQLYVEEFQAAMSNPDAISESQRIIDEVTKRRRPNRNA